jgi:ABC-2 type transport system permease protein
MSKAAAHVLGAEPILLAPVGFGAARRRISALVRRYVYLLRSSGVRLIELIYWPFLQMLTWGFLQKYLAGTASPVAQAAGVLIGSVLLWDILFRSNIGFSTTFIEEMWSRNLGNLLISPLRPYELVAALSLWSVIRLSVSMVPVATAAYFFFGFNLLDLGLPLAAFFVVLVLTSWSLGLIAAGVILRYGLGAEELAWSLAFLLLPLCCVYYPVAVLPVWLKPVALALPPTHVFEGMRSILLHHTFDAKELWWALGLNAIYLFAGYLLFSRFLASARVNGTLLRLGE